jgi:hypothetical protein
MERLRDVLPFAQKEKLMVEKMENSSVEKMAARKGKD